MPKSVFTDEYDILLDLFVKTRRKVGVTQVELGKRLRKPQPWVSNIERGIRRIDILEFIALTRALKVDPLMFLQEYLTLIPADFEV